VAPEGRAALGAAGGELVDYRGLEVAG
jgi:hypothetical protein